LIAWCIALRSYGTPSIRSDLPAPRIRRVDDWTNYGDVPGVWAVINPSVFSQHGVYERDVLEPRSRQQVSTVLAVSHINPLTTTVAVWVQLGTIVCQTGLSHHL